MIEHIAVETNQDGRQIFKMVEKIIVNFHK